MLDVLTVEKLYQERLWILTLQEKSPRAVDAWEAAVRAYIQHVNNAPERYLVYDMLHAPGINFSTYSRERSMVLAKDNPDATGRVALVLPASPAVTYIYNLFLRYTGKQLQPGLEVKIFTDRDRALTWVLEVLPQRFKSETPAHNDRRSAAT